MSHFWILREILPNMVANNHGRIVNICSVASFKPCIPPSFSYTASKFAVKGYTEALKLELSLFKLDGIKVTTVYPYIVQTPMIKSLSVKKEQKNKILQLAMPFSINKFLEPSKLAMKVVDGMRREYEHIYLPSSARMLLFLDK